ncbi:unnamed protein product [Peronospora farinosa]|uniref:Uncharacterized protein n=1 Tax=Peronospora farinosa TaxID=134698 RepID=A0AAV0UZF6_9STRA|nr:unnamed protein product [Peronospora farinosa]
MSSLRCDSLLSTSDHLLDLLYGAIESTLNESIRRRCIQEKWRKLISIRHCRRRGEGTAEKDVKESRNETKQAQQTNNLEEERDTVDAAKKHRGSRVKTNGGGATASVTIAKAATCGRSEA